jgi:hypothetical protein
VDVPQVAVSRPPVVEAPTLALLPQSMSLALAIVSVVFPPIYVGIPFAAAAIVVELLRRAGDPIGFMGGVILSTATVGLVLNVLVAIVGVPT